MAGYRITDIGNLSNASDLKMETLRLKKNEIINSENICPCCGKSAEYQIHYAPATRIPPEVAKYMDGSYRMRERRRHYNSFVKHFSGIVEGPGAYDVLFLEKDYFLFEHLHLSGIEKFRMLEPENKYNIPNDESLLEKLFAYGCVDHISSDDWMYLLFSEILLAKAHNEDRKIESEISSNMPRIAAMMRTPKLNKNSIYRIEYTCKSCNASWFGNIYDRNWNVALNGMAFDTIYDYSNISSVTEAEGPCPICGSRNYIAGIHHSLEGRHTDWKHFLTGQVHISYKCNSCNASWFGNYYNGRLKLAD